VTAAAEAAEKGEEGRRGGGEEGGKVGLNAARRRARVKLSEGPPLSSGLNIVLDICLVFVSLAMFDESVDIPAAEPQGTPC
jgi:hypothetical protein